MARDEVVSVLKWHLSHQDPISIGAAADDDDDDDEDLRRLVIDAQRCTGRGADLDLRCVDVELPFMATATASTRVGDPVDAEALDRARVAFPFSTVSSLSASIVSTSASAKASTSADDDDDSEAAEDDSEAAADDGSPFEWPISAVIGSYVVEAQRSLGARASAAVVDRLAREVLARAKRRGLETEMRRLDEAAEATGSEDKRLAYETASAAVWDLMSEPDPIAMRVALVGGRGSDWRVKERAEGTWRTSPDRVSSVLDPSAPWIHELITPTPTDAVATCIDVSVLPNEDSASDDDWSTDDPEWAQRISLVARWTASAPHSDDVFERDALVVFQDERPRGQRRSSGTATSKVLEPDAVGKLMDLIRRNRFVHALKLCLAERLSEPDLRTAAFRFDEGHVHLRNRSVLFHDV